MISVSKTVDSITYVIGGDEWEDFEPLFRSVGGLTGLIKGTGELEQMTRAVGVVQQAFPDAEVGIGSEGVGEALPRDELADLIRNAPDGNTLTALWKANKAKWTAEHSALAASRKEALTA